jgi:spore coat protein U-like protein
VRALISLALLLIAGAAHAQAPSAAAVAACRIRILPLVYGSYHVLSAARTITVGQIQVRCPLVFPAGVRIGISTGASGDYFDRVMVNGANQLHYNLYADAARTQVVGDGSAGTATLGSTSLARGGAGLAVFRLYGAIAPNQAVPAGDYSDTLQVDVIF